jgi:hypothetical protein
MNERTCLNCNAPVEQHDIVKCKECGKEVCPDCINRHYVLTHDKSEDLFA